MLHATSPRIEGHLPFYSFSRFPLFEYAQLHTPHQGEKFPVFLASFLPHIAISNNYPSQTLICFTEFAGLLYSFQEFGTKDEGGCLSLLLCILHPRSCHFAGEFVSGILRWLSVFISFFIFIFSSLFFSCLAFFCEFSFIRNFSVTLLHFSPILTTTVCSYKEREAFVSRRYDFYFLRELFCNFTLLFSFIYFLVAVENFISFAAFACQVPKREYSKFYTFSFHSFSSFRLFSNHRVIVS